MVDALALHADGHVALEGVLRGAEIDEVAHVGVRPIIQGRVAAEQRRLQRPPARVMQPAADGEAGDLTLRIVEKLTWIVDDAVHPEHGVACSHAQPRRIGNVEPVVGVAADEGQAIGLAQDMFGIDEQIAFVGAIVIGGGAAVGAFDTELRPLELSRYEEVCVPARRSVLEARLVGSVAAAVQRHLAAVVEQADLGSDVDDARRLQPVLGRHGAGDQAHAFHQPRAEGLAEHRNAFRQDDPVDAVLQVVVIVAHVELTETVLGDSGELQDDLIELLVVALRQSLDGGVGHRIDGGAQRRFDGLPGRVEPLSRHHDRRHCSRIAGGVRRIGRRGLGGAGGRGCGVDLGPGLCRRKRQRRHSGGRQ